MIQSGTFNNESLTITGVACDSVSTVTSLTLGGQSVALTGTPPCLDFSTQLDSRWGLNVISGTAKNQAGAKRQIAQAYLRSPAYFTAPAKRTTRASDAAEVDEVPSGIYMQLNQTVADDGNRSDANDLATLIALQLSTIDLNTLVPDPIVVSPDANNDGLVDSHSCNCVFPIPDIVVHSTGYRVGRKTMTGALALDYVRFVNGGVDVGMTASGISLPVTVNGYLDPTCAVACVTRNLTSGVVTGTIYADAITIDMQVAISSSGGVPQVSICPSCVSINLLNLRLDIDWGVLEFLDAPLGLSNITTSIINSFQNLIENELDTQLRSILPPLVANFIDSFQLPPTVTLPPPMNTVLNLATSFDVDQFPGPERQRRCASGALRRRLPRQPGGDESPGIDPPRRPGADLQFDAVRTGRGTQGRPAQPVLLGRVVRRRVRDSGRVLESRVHRSGRGRCDHVAHSAAGRDARDQRQSDRYRSG